MNMRDRRAAIRLWLPILGALVAWLPLPVLATFDIYDQTIWVGTTAHGVGAFRFNSDVADGDHPIDAQVPDGQVFTLTTTADFALFGAGVQFNDSATDPLEAVVLTTADGSNVEGLRGQMVANHMGVNLILEFNLSPNQAGSANRIYEVRVEGGSSFSSGVYSILNTGPTGTAPEPGILLVFASGLGAMALMVQRRRRSSNRD